jgi:hypothetical protein
MRGDPGFDALLGGNVDLMVYKRCKSESRNHSKMPAVPTAPTGKKAPTPERGRELTASQRSFNKYHRRVRSQIERYFNPRVPPSCVHVPKKTDINVPSKL